MIKSLPKNMPIHLWVILVVCSQHLEAVPLNLDGTLALRHAVSVAAIREHQHHLQLIAERYHGTRVAGSAGYDVSTTYVRERMQAAGYEVRLQEFTFHQVEDHSLPQLVVEDIDDRSFEPNNDFASMSALGYAEVKAEVEAVDLKVPSPHPNYSTSGCEKEDFTHFKRGNIALLQRGTCTFHVKAENALLAGAVGVIIFNEGNPGRTVYISSRVKPSLANFPVLGASFEVGDILRASQMNGPTGIHVFMRTDVAVEQRIVHNVIAETRAGDPGRVVVVGAHLDSVENGPGINDNGSGSATNLAIAEKYAELGLIPKNKLRFIWFSAEEFGLLGAEHYVKSLTHHERMNIMAMLNFDMLGSSNYARFVYDGDNSAHTTVNAQSGPQGSAYLEKLFQDYFLSQQLVNHPTAFDGRSDYGPFIEIGIPAGGLFSGAEAIKSPELAKIYGGSAFEPFDPCYHQACDDFIHTGGDEQYALALKSIDELSDAAAHAIVHLASTDDIIRSSDLQLLKPAPVDFEYRGNLLLK